MKLLHRAVKRQVADKAIGWQSPVSPVNNQCFLCSGTKQLYRGCCSDRWNWLCGNFCCIANSALLHGWVGGPEYFSVWWWWVGRDYVLQLKEPLPITCLLHRCPWLTKAISPAIPVYNGLVFLFVLANFSMATFMDPGVFPRGNRNETFRGWGRGALKIQAKGGARYPNTQVAE